MAKLYEVAEMAQNLYFQGYAGRTEFFDEDDFMYNCATKYSEIINKKFQDFRVANKAETGFSNVEINAQWLITQVVDKLEFDELQQRWYAKTDQNIFSFDFDSFGNGLNGVRPYGRNNCNLKKISNQEIRFYDIVPFTPDIYYFVEGKNQVHFLNKPPLPLSLYYIPEVLGSDENCVLSDNVVNEVIMATLQLMFGAKNGNVVPEADDGNQNEVMGQQTNPTLNKVQQM